MIWFCSDVWIIVISAVMDDDDKTVVMPGRQPHGPRPTGPVTVKYRDQQGQERVRQFTTAFIIGREPSCEVRLGENMVSRRHVEVVSREGSWWVRDLDSANGTYLGRKRIKEHLLQGVTELQLGKVGPVVWLELPW